MNEFETLVIIAVTADPSKPHCAGPLLIHVTGDFECHGPCAEGPESGLYAFYHDADTPTPCSRALVRQLETLRTRCRRCR